MARKLQKKVAPPKVVRGGGNFEFFNIGAPNGDIPTTPYGPGRTFPASGTSPVPPGSHYAYVRVKHFKVADITTIPANPPADAVTALRTGSTNDWTIAPGVLLVSNLNINLPHIILAWNFIYTGSTLATLHSIDIAFFVPKP
jgi:hypothetical protein